MLRFRITATRQGRRVRWEVRLTARSSVEAIARVQALLGKAADGLTFHPEVLATTPTARTA